MTVADLLRGYRGARVHVLPNPGNGGDGLIARGLRDLAATYELALCELQYPQAASGELLLIPGCGNLCVSYYGAAERAMPYLAAFRSVAVLPSSIEPASPEVAAFLRALPRAAHVFAREHRSAALVRALPGAPDNVWTDHDLAFSANVSAWRTRAGRGTLYAFRQDPESTGHAPPQGNFDISGLTADWMSELFLDVVSSFDAVYTDRAHVAIAAAMLGRETHVYPNAYHKVRGIAEFSLAAYPNVHFHEERTPLPAIDLAADRRFGVWHARAHAEAAPEQRAALGAA
jgi:hypothetical protein